MSLLFLKCIKNYRNLYFEVGNYWEMILYFFLNCKMFMC